MRQFLQFRMSTLLLLVALFAVALGWWKDHGDLQRRLRDTDDKLRDAELLRDAILEGREVFNKPILESAQLYFRRHNLVAGAALPAILEFLNDPRPEVRLDAVHELVGVAPPQTAISALLQVFANDADERIHRHAAASIFVLEWVRTDRAVAPRAE